MSAQVPAALQNGVRVAESTYGTVSHDGGGERPKAIPEDLTVQRQVPKAEPMQGQPSELRSRGTGDVRSSVETTTMAAQGEQTMIPTTWDMSGRSTLDRSDPVTTAADNVGEFLTPRSTMGGRVAQPAWLAGVEMPRWFMRLGNLLQATGSGIPPSDLAPSPMPGTSPGLYTTSSGRSSVPAEVTGESKGNPASAVSTVILVGSSRGNPGRSAKATSGHCGSTSSVRR